ncbi:MAG: symmetrical bis(5'-nucleosyl)-tetraphosphatase [Gammaproteobacteria bacterium]|nr:symmetrical bis(5'-nucleosyl)-tetraphosphatase [Gammaproteobacteria bacterium]MCW5583281.1 symmetrical bis(5'-nucleosyl)-tetraphosphatase [Gammaproteobacteria bacterium]
MTTYVIGDVQGCFTELEALLKQIDFRQDNDTLWFTGDLVNRGPCSLEVLRFVKSLDQHQVAVLGNHDLHLLAVAYGVRELHRDDTLDEILTAPDKNELIDWLRHRPLLHYDKSTGYVMAHAGLAPLWNLTQARRLAEEVEMLLRGGTPETFLKGIYGNQPDYWDDHLSGIERWRCIVNFLTRMRFCYADGRLDLSYKGEIGGKPKELIPWFDVPERENVNEKIIFGHWAALNGKTDAPNLYALDTGCVWGNSLTAMCLENGERFSVHCGNR